MVEHWLPKPRVAGSNPFAAQKCIIDCNAMAIILLAILLIGLLLIATEPLNHINKAAVAIFAGVCCWLLYIANGIQFVAAEHPIDFLNFLSTYGISANSVKAFIAQHIFVNYIAQCASIFYFACNYMYR